MSSLGDFLRNRKRVILLIIGFSMVSVSSSRAVLTVSEYDKEEDAQKSVSYFAVRRTQISYYYAFNVMLRDDFLAYDNLEEIFSYYDKKGALRENRFQIQIDRTKLDQIYDYCQQSELGREHIEIILKKDEELEFRFGSYTWETEFTELEDFVVVYDGKFLILKRTTNETKLSDIWIGSAIPNELEKISKYIAEAIYYHFEEKLFRLHTTNCIEMDSFQNNFIKWANCISCELVYIDIEAEELIAFRENVEIARNEECLGYLRFKYGNEYVNVRLWEDHSTSDVEVVYAVSDVKTRHNFQIATNMKDERWINFEELSQENDDWVEPDVYLNLLEIQRTCLETQYYLKKEMDDIKKESSEKRDEGDFGTFFEWYEDKMTRLNSLEYTLELTHTYLDMWQEKNNPWSSRYIRPTIEEKIQEIESIILENTNYVEFLRLQLQREYVLLETRISEKSLEISKKNLTASENVAKSTNVLLLVTIGLLGVTIVPPVVTFFRNWRRRKEKHREDLSILLRFE